MSDPERTIQLARHISVALQQFDESVINADGTAASKFNTLQALLRGQSDWIAVVWESIAEIENIYCSVCSYQRGKHDIRCPIRRIKEVLPAAPAESAKGECS